MGAIPRNSQTNAIVLAVNCPPQAPAPGHAAPSSDLSCASVIPPRACLPTASKTSWMVTEWPSNWPGAFEGHSDTIQDVFEAVLDGDGMALELARRDRG